MYLIRSSLLISSDSTSKYCGDGWEADNDVWTGDRIDDKETREAARSSRHENGKVFPGSDMKIRNEHIRGTLKVGRFGQNVRQSRLR